MMKAGQKLDIFKDGFWMKDDLAKAIAKAGDDPRLKAVLAEICAASDMGFAAIACVTRDRWITCQVEDKVDFGLDPGSELDVKTTICNDIRDYGNAIVIDDVIADKRWRRHPTPVLYGFRSYASYPLFLDGSTFFGTLCAIDESPREVSARTIVEIFEHGANKITAILSEIFRHEGLDVAALIGELEQQSA
jgi:GAF domain-containing protein